MDKTTSADGTPLAYDRVGDGPAVVCVGGALNTRHTSARLAHALADRFTVYLYDRRGRGDSGDTGPYAVDREIEDLAAIVAVAGGPARVYGMSSGAILALRAEAAGVPIARLAGYEPPLPALAPPAPERYPERLAAALAEGRRDEALRLFMVEVVGLPAEPAAGAARIPDLLAIAHTLPYDDAVITGGPVPVSPRVPTLTLAGGASPAWMREASRAVAGEHRVLPGQTHDVDPVVLAEALADFFA
ncbi:alpha/beta fold hydrolase [Actinophytocola gossypii]|uniref:Alpha/beta fold hydrolase n=1 Tax=Actinophytocola gossypii TaxID=2812003 RepID=A0ABT2J4P9_9PSEU|nr:alpha/beta hydrolase [Actinophytocola gossypii]MCT2582833.1 alpha/beta fold hydrolase [Actinophytocola gossypii]